MIQNRADIVFIAMQIIGISLMYFLWIFDGGVSGFFLIASLTMLAVLRRRFFENRGWLKYTVIVDIAFCIALASEWGYAVYFIALPLFSAMYFGVYLALIVGVYILFDFNPLLMAMLLFSATSRVFLRFGHMSMRRSCFLEMRPPKGITKGKKRKITTHQH